jgi:hypothetical protein
MYSELGSKIGDREDSRASNSYSINQKKILRGQAPSQNPNTKHITVRGGGGKAGSPGAPSVVAPQVE